MEFCFGVYFQETEEREKKNENFWVEFIMYIRCKSNIYIFERANTFWKVEMKMANRVVTQLLLYFFFVVFFPLSFFFFILLSIYYIHTLI